MPPPPNKTTTKNMRNKYLSPLPYINNINYFKKNDEHIFDSLEYKLYLKIIIC